MVPNGGRRDTDKLCNFGILKDCVPGGLVDNSILVVGAQLLQRLLDLKNLVVKFN